MNGANAFAHGGQSMGNCDERGTRKFFTNGFGDCENGGTLNVNNEWTCESVGQKRLAQLVSLIYLNRSRDGHAVSQMPRLVMGDCFNDLQSILSEQDSGKAL